MRTKTTDIIVTLLVLVVVFLIVFFIAFMNPDNVHDTKCCMNINNHCIRVSSEQCSKLENFLEQIATNETKIV